MTVRTTTPPRRAFDHRMTAPGTDEAFLAAALPFLAEGLAAADEPPPVAIVAPAKVDALRDALGSDAEAVTLVPHTDWYTGSAANAVARAAGHLATHAGPDGRVHLLMEPVWNGRAGRSPRESAEWLRYEALANLLFAHTSTTALCVYDTRTTAPDLVAAARRTHPDSGAYEDPLRLAAELDAVPLPRPPADARHLPAPTTDAVRSWAAGQGLGAADAELFAQAVTEAASLAPVTSTLLWGEAPACVCELRLSDRLDDPLAGFVPPPSVTPSPGQGLWFTRQVCSYVDLRPTREGTAVRLQYG
ncbi:MEDS domain-containing protein [Streptomyces phaeoluteigriseus]|uniref:MEDS domain-containing protein n=1 Tax=Streptomyces phaeoluteigriseus TaxID=114686 RepID=A0ABY4Z3V3_9ACTN|nr:MEDS domain-containing protein [Streptomyces phaeoluteigriseus]USQ83225.1 MEDS domain-containing protein [Streptomyces phaeoluteigriseus]